MIFFLKKEKWKKERLLNGKRYKIDKTIKDRNRWFFYYYCAHKNIFSKNIILTFPTTLLSYFHHDFIYIYIFSYIRHRYFTTFFQILIKHNSATLCFKQQHRFLYTFFIQKTSANLTDQQIKIKIAKKKKKKKLFFVLF